MKPTVKFEARLVFKIREICCGGPQWLSLLPYRERHKELQQILDRTGALARRGTDARSVPTLYAKMLN